MPCKGGMTTGQRYRLRLRLKTVQQSDFHWFAAILYETIVTQVLILRETVVQWLGKSKRSDDRVLQLLSFPCSMALLGSEIMYGAASLLTLLSKDRQECIKLHHRLCD